MHFALGSLPNVCVHTADMSDPVLGHTPNSPLSAETPQCFGYLADGGIEVYQRAVKKCTVWRITSLTRIMTGLILEVV